MATNRVITSIDSRRGKRGRRETFSFSGVEAQNHIDEYMKEVRMTKADLETYEANASASAAAAASSEAKASTSEANSKASETAAAKCAEEASEAVDKVVVATDGVVEKCQEAAEQATTAASSAGSSAASAQEAAEAAQKAADQAGAAIVGVSSFNGRAGAVMPQSGDYTAEMVGAASEERVASVETDLNTVGEDLTALSSKVTTLVGSDTGKSVRSISAEELAAQLIPENAQASLDTLKEIAAWIQSHPDEAAAMNEKITSLQSLMTALSGRVSINETDIASLETNIGGKADKATTLSGYGITDAYTKSEVNANTIKGLSISGTTITVIFGDGSTTTLTTQDTDTTYTAATTSKAGLMSASDKTKLNGVATGATKNTVDSALSSTSTNAVQNKVVYSTFSQFAAKLPIRLATQSLTSSGGTLTFTDSSIGDDSLIDVYASIPNIAPSAITQSGTSVTVTFDAQDSAFDVAIVVQN